MLATLRHALTMLCVALGVGIPLAAQTGDLGDMPGSIVSRAPIAGAPLVAEVAVSIPRVVGGTPIIYAGRARYFRDGHGRVRVDQFLVPAAGGRSGTEFRSILQTGKARPAAVWIDHAGRRVTEVGTGLARMFVGGDYYVVATGQQSSLNAPGAAQTRAFHKLVNGTAPETALGSRMFSGVEAEGRRLTVVVPAGAERNDAPVTIVEERWDSPALGITLYARLADPRVGVAEYQVTSMKRVEPGPEHFALPEGYSVGLINPTHSASWESWLNPPFRSRR